MLESPALTGLQGINYFRMSLACRPAAGGDCLLSRMEGFRGMCRPGRLVWAGFGLAVLALLSACSGPAPLPTLRPVVVTVYLTGTPAPARAATATVGGSQPSFTRTPPAV